LLETIATEAAALVENASLAQAELATRQHREELNIAARFQQDLMAVQVPQFPFARVEARSLPCKEVGGDFYDVIAAEDRFKVIPVAYSAHQIHDKSDKRFPVYLEKVISETEPSLIATLHDPASCFEVLVYCKTRFLFAQSVELSVEFSLFCNSRIGARNELSTLSGSHLETGPRFLPQRKNGS
jgi:hypothetical protein